MPGAVTSETAELAAVLPAGVRLLVGGEELFLPFSEFPWLRDATVAQLENVQRPSADHLYWSDIDVDLSVDSIRHPDRYPLKAR